MHHYAIHAGFDFTAPLSLKLYYIQCLNMGGKIGVNLFVLISGYFLCTSTFSIKRIIKLELQVIFYSILIPVLFFAFMPNKVTVIDILKGVTPLRSRLYWFYTVYFFLAVISPFLNKMISAMKKKDLRQLIFILAVFWILTPLLPKFGTFLYSLSGWFIFLYLCAAYIRLYPEDFSKSSYFYIYMGIATYLLILLYVLSFDLLGLFDMKFREKINYYIPERNILVFFSSAMLFTGFSKLNLGTRKMLNSVSSAMFGVYLIHDNTFSRDFLWRDFFQNARWQNSNWIFLHAIIAISSVLILSTLIDKARQFIFGKAVFPIIDRVTEKIRPTDSGKI